ncbi:hypothetical protein N6N90_21830, partial [Escherichia coli]|nr:hypothetical protein [Escherichia coli]MDC7057212.1 hypothetical protein [Escherichia coli]
AQIREILINESAWEEMTCLFAPSLGGVGALHAIRVKESAMPVNTGHNFIINPVLLIVESKYER